MQIHIWRQFSSNHSADFTLVGEFETPERAHVVADEMRLLIKNITKWYESPENNDTYVKMLNTWNLDVLPTI